MRVADQAKRGPVSEKEETVLPSGHDSLALGVGQCQPGTIFVLSVTGGITLRPKEGREILFGRNRPDVHVCLGEDDLTISRVHGRIVRGVGDWWIHGEGRAPLRLPDSRLLSAGEEPATLPAGYTPVFVRGAAGREHLLEVYVAGEAGSRPQPRHADATSGPRPWRLSEEERLVLTTLGRRYLMHEARPVPLTWRQAAEVLTKLRPGAGWTAKRVEHATGAVRARLSRAGVPGLTREEVGEPVGNALNDNLLRELVLTATLIPTDLHLLDTPP